MVPSPRWSVWSCHDQRFESDNHYHRSPEGDPVCPAIRQEERKSRPSVLRFAQGARITGFLLPIASTPNFETKKPKDPLSKKIPWPLSPIMVPWVHESSGVRGTASEREAGEAVGRWLHLRIYMK